MNENKKKNSKIDKDLESALSRRNFVSAATKFALIAALIDLPVGALAADGRQVEAFFEKAIDVGDMRTALEKYAESYRLTHEQIKALSQVDINEFRVISSLSRLRFSDSQMGQIVMATRSSSDPKRLVGYAQKKMELTDEQVDGLAHLSSGEIDAFRSLATKLGSSTLIGSGITDW